MKNILVDESIEVIEKKAKLDTLESILTDFDFVKIINENPLNKILIIHAQRKNDKEPDTEVTNRNAVVIFEKSHFNLEEIKAYLEMNNPMDWYINNDAYKKLCIYPSKPFNSNILIFFYNYSKCNKI